MNQCYSKLFIILLVLVNSIFYHSSCLIMMPFRNSSLVFGGICLDILMIVTFFFIQSYSKQLIFFNIFVIQIFILIICIIYSILLILFVIFLIIFIINNLILNNMWWFSIYSNYNMVIDYLIKPLILFIFMDIIILIFLLVILLIF